MAEVRSHSQPETGEAGSAKTKVVWRSAGNSGDANYCNRELQERGKLQSVADDIPPSTVAITQESSPHPTDQSRRFNVATGLIAIIKKGEVTKVKGIQIRAEW
jgi:hypothetical protein